ncbi:MAG: quinolinate synthase NadA [Vampirovibrionia bacterium]
MKNQQELIKQILSLKKEKNAIILTHFYQRFNLYKIADFIGDSLDLSRKAANCDADIIVFCGVYFMAETAKILSPQKKVFLPSMGSGCLMADMIEPDDLIELKNKYPDAAVVCYVNSTASIKALSDICCTSANAIKILQSLPHKQIIFVPDKGLGAYAAQFVPDKEVILYDGFCPTHWRITVEDIENTKQKYPGAVVLAHPECDAPVIKASDYVGSTSGMADYAKDHPAQKFIVASDVGILLYMKEKMPEKDFILPTREAVCPNMKKNSLLDVYNCLNDEINEIHVDPQIAKEAVKSINRMLDVV